MPPHRAQYPTIPGLLGHLTHVTNPWTDSERDCLFHSFLPPSLSSPSMGNSQPDCSDSLLWFHKGQHFKSSLQAFFPSLPPSLPSFLQDPGKAVERRGYGERAWCFAASLGVQHSFKKSGHTSGMPSGPGCCGREVTEVGLRR